MVAFILTLVFSARPMVDTPMLSCTDQGSTRLVGKAEQSSVFGPNE